MWARFAVIVALALPAAAARGPQQPPVGPAAAQSERAAARIRALQAEAAALASREKSLLGDLQRFEIERDLRAAELQRLEPEVAALESQVAETTRRLDELDVALRGQQPALAARLVDTYKLGRPGYARLWLAVSDLRAIGRAYRLAAALARIDQDRFDDYRNTAAKLSTGRTDLDRRLAALGALRDDARRARSSADAAVASRGALIAEIDQRRDLNAQMVGELRQAQAGLQQMLASLPPAGGALAPAAEAGLLPLKPFRGELEWPVRGQLISSFGPHIHPRFGTTTISTGVEIAAADGAPACAVHDGVVAFADSFAGFGLLVILDHGGQAYSLYGHLATIDLSPGTRVTTGQQVGTIGRGLTGKPALYFELRIDGQPVDPVQWLKPRSDP
jgi:septal ring factor EnvC (AmiA/AmiB activator)